MKVLFITGSGRTESVTTKLCEMTASAMPGAETTIIRPHMMRVAHCTGCGECSSGECVADDDMHRIYSEVERSDIIILATPVYFSGPSSIMKQVIDRFQCVWSKGVGDRDKAVALIAAGGHSAPVFSNTISIAKAFAATIGARWAGELTLCGTDYTGSANDLAERTKAFASEVIGAYSEGA